MLTSYCWRYYSFSFLLTTIASTSRLNRTSDPSLSRSNLTFETAARRPFLSQPATPDHLRRFRREGVIQSLTDQGKQDVVDKHNYYRRKEGASNMKKLMWNDYLAEMASDWAKGCTLQHGNPLRDANTMPYKYPGQNLFFSPVVDRGLPFGIDHYMKEKDFHDVNMDTCLPDKDCGHYYQVVWATTEAVGCADAKCENTFFHVCNYGPGMEVGPFVTMYTKGEACSTCVDSQWCEEGLCVRDCKDKDPGRTCDCQSACQHCGKADPTTCKCKCADGYMGPDCSAKCTQKQNCVHLLSETCSTNEFLRRECPALCGLCVAAAPGAADKNCPVDRVNPVRGSGRASPRVSLQQLLIEIHLVLCLQYLMT